ncbi:MAG: hypothetical protein AAFV37_09270 [Pseudomonadota bacterium]
MRWILIALMMPTLFASAEEDAHHVAFLEGRYEEAATVAETTPSPDHLAFAARSLLAEAMSDPSFSPPQELILMAEGKAREALNAAPGHIEARLQLAIALSLKIRPLSNREGMRTGHAEEAKELVEAVLRDDPTNSYAHGFLAVWHLEVRRRGGSIGASIMGASVRKAREHYQAAIHHAPGDASIHWQYARALAALNAKKHADEIDTVLSLAIACSPRNSLEGVMKSRAELLHSKLETEGRRTVERVAAQML